MVVSHMKTPTNQLASIAAAVMVVAAVAVEAVAAEVVAEEPVAVEAVVASVEVVEAASAEAVEAAASVEVAAEAAVLGVLQHNPKTIDGAMLILDTAHHLEAEEASAAAVAILVVAEDLKVGQEEAVEDMVAAEGADLEEAHSKAVFFIHSSQLPKTLVLSHANGSFSNRSETISVL